MSWQKTKISEFLTERKDRFKPDKANELGLPRIEKIDFSGTIYINNFKPTKTGMILVKNGDLVISGINVEKGALAIYKGNTDALATIHYSSYTYDENKIDIDFLKWYLQSNIFRNILKEQVKGGIKTEIKPKTFLNLEIMLPDLTTQKKIASKLNKLEWNVKDLDFTCFCNKELIDKLRQSILQEAIQGKLVPQNPNDEPASALLKKIKAEKEQLIKARKIKKEKYIIPDNNLEIVIPKNWCMCVIQDISLKVTDGEHLTPQRANSGYFLLSARNITNQGLKLDNVDYVDEREFNRIRKRCNPNKSDILISCSGSVGRVCLADKDNCYVMVRSVAMVRPHKNIYPEYLVYALKSDFLQKQIEKSSKITAQANLFLGKILELQIPLPPTEEQKRIVRKVDELMQLCDKLENENNNAQKASSELLQSIMQKYFTPEV